MWGQLSGGLIHSDRCGDWLAGGYLSCQAAWLAVRQLFAIMLQASPGAMIFLGVAPSGIARPAPNHSNKMSVDEAALHRGVVLHALLALAN
jgi:hypothetical protein